MLLQEKFKLLFSTYKRAEDYGEQLKWTYLIMSDNRAKVT